MYYLTVKTQRKNAKRHIVRKNNDIKLLIDLLDNLSDQYICEIYDGKWKLIKSRGVKDEK